MNKSEFLPLTTHKNQVQMDQRLKCKTWNYEILSRNIREIVQSIDIGKICWIDFKCTGNESKNRQLGNIKLRNFFKGNNKQIWKEKNLKNERKTFANSSSDKHFHQNTSGTQKTDLKKEKKKPNNNK
jgi:hypothetical protein